MPRSDAEVPIVGQTKATRNPRGADITKCTSTNGVLSACGTGTSTRVARGADAERPNRLWLNKFNKNLADFSVPAPAL